MEQPVLKEFLDIQATVFSAVSKKLKSRFPHKSLELAVPIGIDDPIIEDLCFLRDHAKLIFNPSWKVFPLELGNDHPIRLVVYYRGNPIGYAFGNINYKNAVVEILWMEKRNDAHEDLDHQFLAIVMQSYLAYASVVGTMNIPVAYFALVNPMAGVKSYYEQSGFKYFADYLKKGDAMVMQLGELSPQFQLS